MNSLQISIMLVMSRRSAAGDLLSSAGARDPNFNVNEKSGRDA